MKFPMAARQASRVLHVTPPGVTSCASRSLVSRLKISSALMGSPAERPQPWSRENTMLLQSSHQRLG